MSFVNHRLKDCLFNELFNLSALFKQTVVTSVALGFYNSGHFSLNVLAISTRESLLL